MIIGQFGHSVGSTIAVLLLVVDYLSLQSLGRPVIVLSSGRTKLYWQLHLLEFPSVYLVSRRTVALEAALQ